jgi:hypothetical protein
VWLQNGTPWGLFRMARGSALDDFNSVVRFTGAETVEP